jgi:uroporphyrinogen decarboxylase
VDIAHARSVVGDEVILAGNINPVLVQDKTRDEVYTLCSDLVQKHRNERFILSAGCEITVLTPPENLKAMNEARY